MSEFCVNCGKPTGNINFVICTLKCGVELKGKEDQRIPLTGKENLEWWKSQGYVPDEEQERRVLKKNP